MAAWAQDAIFYHIYPLGLLGAPARNDLESSPVPRLERLHGWVDHLRWLGTNALYLGPLFESSEHGYDTVDYYRVDRRLGSNRTLAELVRALHGAGIRVVLDGVFHHVGRDFPQFRDLRERGQDSPFRDWFAGIDFRYRSPYGDPFAYDGWQGHYNLVKLNLRSPEVRELLLGAVRVWIEEFDIDGLRLDVAEVVDPDFLRALSAHCRELRPDFLLIGEMIHGDYRRLAGPSMLDATTNYEAYKGLWSSLNDRNYFEIAYALNRQFGSDGVYKGLPLYNFADNHDVDRVASMLRNPAHLYPLHLLLFTMPGMPSVYAGSEWGIEGRRSQESDAALRPELADPQTAAAGAARPRLADAIRRLARVRRESEALRRGDYEQLHVAHEQFAFERRSEREQVVVALNAADQPVALELPLGGADGRILADLLDPEVRCEVSGGRLRIDSVPACWGRILLAR